jgi:hypothetical protein
MKHGCLLVAAALAASPVVPAQAQSTPSSPPTCRALLDGMKEKVEADYAGFVLEVRGHPRMRAYQDVVTRLRSRADNAHGDDCFGVLDAFVRWFDDPHLFVYQNGDIDSAESRRRQSQVRRITMDEAGARRYFAAAAHLDPIEGIWSSGPLRVAVMQEPDSSAGHFAAVVLTPDTATWAPGSVRARFVRRRDGTYDAALSAPNFAVTHPDAVIHKRVLLRLSPQMWGKIYPVAPADSGLLDPADPRRPTLLVRGRTVIVSMTSHSPQYKEVLDSLVAAHAAELRSAQRLIVDLRGNEGGSASTGDALLPYIASDSQGPDPLNFREAVMLSSPDQIRYAGRAFGDSTSAFARSLLARLRANPGGFVPVVDPASPEQADPPVPVIRGSERVAVLIDGGTVSAAEVLVLEARRSRRVTIYGEPTEGALDYQSTSVVRLVPGENRWFLGYPTITANTRLPEGGMRGKGILPDVRVDWLRVADPFRAIEELMR